MWMLILNFLIITGFSAGSDDCDEPNHLKCPVSDSSIFPETEEEFASKCQADIDFFECLIRHEEKCHKDPSIIPIMNMFINEMQYFCDKNNPRYEGIVKGLKCVKPILIHRGECWNTTRIEDLQTMHTEKLVNARLPMFTEQDDITKGCVQRLTVFACEAAKIAHLCGEKTMDAYIEILYTRNNVPGRNCNDKVKEHLHNILRVLATEEESAEEIEFLSGSDDCDEPIGLKCTRNFGFPETEEELASICRDEIEYYGCLIHHEEKCDNDPESLLTKKISQAETRYICDKEKNPRYADVVEGLKCVKPILVNPQCWFAEPSEDVLTMNRENLINAGLPIFTEGEENVIQCVERLTMFACEASKVEQQCGEKTMDAYIEVLNTRSANRQASCDPKVKEHLRDILRALTTVKEATEVIEEAMKEK